MKSQDVVSWKEAIKWHSKVCKPIENPRYVILSNGFMLNQADKCVHNKFDRPNKAIIGLYVDDMLIFGTNQNQVDRKFLSSSFYMKDMGEAEVILGIRIKRQNKRITITQSHYIEKVLKKFNYFNYSPMSTPSDPSVKFMPNSGKRCNTSSLRLFDA
ncbi:LOW QUALITY PROTEIN: hypothetical protein OSB04_001853 [Centaurea solstitialis]|uniref:Reverse transcriptase Ty1/copia-type domain-containing protein n=1 Tax=Centaurea solstitialis TaxID=347529 RepID=A0AA38U9W3_9ASTR|nr:LOW QUALITY PROTEIN: hypothetical protein OSB04_001853 [Centaurea solstitialis]